MGGTGKTVLVVDDEAAIRLLCRVNLELEGFAVREASSISEGRTMLDDVDVVLVDVHVGEDDGRDLVRDLVTQPVRPGVALLTGSVQLGPGERAGADALIEKPFTLEALIAVVRRLAGIDSAST